MLAKDPMVSGLYNIDGELINCYNIVCKAKEIYLNCNSVAIADKKYN